MRGTGVDEPAPAPAPAAPRPRPGPAVAAHPPPRPRPGVLITTRTSGLCCAGGTGQQRASPAHGPPETSFEIR